jgi:hypothetical protein
MGRLYDDDTDTWSVEDRPNGYPRFAALLSSHPSFHVYRRFLRLRSRLLLYKQDSLTALEERLDQIDRDEPRLLFLGNRRRDKSDARSVVMGQIEQQLGEYGVKNSANTYMDTQS